VTIRQVPPCLFHARTKADRTSQSFHFQGFPATHLFERVGRIADPMYHNTGTNFLGSDANQPLIIRTLQATSVNVADSISSNS